jgi:hypothetical protein
MNRERGINLVNFVALFAELVNCMKQGLFVAKQAQDIFLGHKIRWLVNSGIKAT